MTRWAAKVGRVLAALHTQRIGVLVMVLSSLPFMAGAFLIAIGDFHPPIRVLGAVVLVFFLGLWLYLPIWVTRRR